MKLPIDEKLWGRIEFRCEEFIHEPHFSWAQVVMVKETGVLQSTTVCVSSRLRQKPRMGMVLSQLIFVAIERLNAQYMATTRGLTDG